MVAYVIFIRESINDPHELAEYRDQARQALSGHPMTVLAPYAPHEVWEGPEADAILLAEFPTIEAARAWYCSPAYQAAKAHRLRGADYRVIVTQSTP